VLGGEHHRLDAAGRLPVVPDGDLGLAVRAQPLDDVLTPHVRELLGETVRQVDGQGHEDGRLGAGVAHHEALVPRALEVIGVLHLAGPHLPRLVHPSRDVGRLLPDRDGDPAGVAVEADVGGGVPDVPDLGADDLGDLGVTGGGDLPGHVHEARGDHRLHRDPGGPVLFEEGVEDRVGDAVADLVGMALGHGLGGEEAQLGHRVILAACAAPPASRPPCGRPRPWCPRHVRPRFRPHPA